MKTFNKPYYRCDHCNKIYVRKHACEKHEGICYNNPKNWDACIGCKFCERIAKTIEQGYDYDYSEIKTAYFQCKKKGFDMYPFKAIIKNLPNRFPEDFEDQIQMPNKCEDFKSEYIMDLDLLGNMKL